MALDRETKESLVADYSQGFAAAPHAFVLGFSRISVPQADALRSQVRERGGRYQVVKNRLALIAMRGTGIEALAEHFEGPTAVAYSEDDPVALAKVLTDFAKDADVLEFRGGLLDGTPIEAGEIKTIAELPSREELLTKLVFLLQSPIARMVRGLGAITQQLVTVLEQVRLQKESQPQPAVEEPAAEPAVEEVAEAEEPAEAAEPAEAEPAAAEEPAEAAEPEKAAAVAQTPGETAASEAVAESPQDAPEESSEEPEDAETEPEQPKQ